MSRIDRLEPLLKKGYADSLKYSFEKAGATFFYFYYTLEDMGSSTLEKVHQKYFESHGFTWSRGRI